MSTLASRIQGLTGDALRAELEHATSDEIAAALFAAKGQPATQGDLRAVLEGVRDSIAAALRARDVRIENLEKRLVVAETKAAESMEYFGVWKAGAYRRGAAVTWGPGVWVARRLTSAKPGEGGGEDVTGWTLALRRGDRGRDGKDA